LKGVGKGWYNLDETRREVYQISKLRCFLEMVRFRMEDTIRFLVIDSLETLATFLETSSDNEVLFIFFFFIPFFFHFSLRLKLTAQIMWK